MKFENYSEKTKAVLLDGNWVRVADHVLPFLNKITRGSEVEVKIEGEGKDATLNFIKVIGAAKPAYVPKPYIAPVQQQTSVPQRRNQSYALSYAKDLAVAGKIGVNQVIEYAVIFEKWMDEGLGPKDMPIPEETVE